MAHTIVSVPEGHSVQVHAPGAIPVPPIMPMTGMAADPMAAGGKAAMDAALPPAPKPKAEPKKKKVKVAAEKKPTKGE